MKKAYENWNPNNESRQLLDTCDGIIRAYMGQGYDLTLRQLYYQLVARDEIPNTLKSYNRIKNIIGRGRMAGMIDWDAIEDRARSTVSVGTWESPASIIDAAARQFKLDLWERQPWHIEVMCEKDALSGVLEPACMRERVNFTANKGYSSLSHLYRMGRRLKAHGYDKKIAVLYFGDFDPSGLDMDRDLQDRLSLFSDWTHIEFTRAALTVPQIEEFNPPPNPAKLTDSRAEGYIAEHGNTSWELDAVEPAELERLVRQWVAQYRNDNLWAEDKAQEDEYLADLREFAETYD